MGTMGKVKNKKTMVNSKTTLKSIYIDILKCRHIKTRLRKRKKFWE